MIVLRWLRLKQARKIGPSEARRFNPTIMETIEQVPAPSESPRFYGEERRQAARNALTPEHFHAVLEALLEISNYVGSVMVLDDILQKIVEITARLMNIQSCSIYLWNEDRTRLVMRCNVGLEPELIGHAFFEKGQGFPGWVAETGELLALADGENDPRYQPLASTLQRDFHAYLCAPLRIQADIIGTMGLRKKSVHEFTADEITIAEMICKQAAIVIEKAQMHDAQAEAEKLAAVAVSLSGVAHYIKNLQTSMRGGEYLVETGIKREDMKLIGEGWNVLKRSNSKIRDLVENMLNFYRDTAIHPRPVDLNGFILEILQGLEDRAMEKGTFLTPDLDLRLEKVEIDPDGFADVLINLVTNAIDAIHPGTEGIVQIQTRLDAEGHLARISVRDNGSGIKPEDQKKLFNLFFSTKGKKGTGIGLAASRRIIQEHHGTINFHSDPGLGTEFIIAIPLSQQRHVQCVD